MSLDNWFSLATAVGTLALAVATFVLALKTAASARSGEELAELAERELIQAHLPVVVPVIEELRVQDDEPIKQGAAVIHRNTTTVYVPIVNIGVGPALGIDLELYWLDQVGGQSVAPQPDKLPAKLGGLASAARWDVKARFHALAANPPLPFEVTILFSDTSGTRYRTWGRFFPEQQMFEELQLQTLADDGSVLSARAI